MYPSSSSSQLSEMSSLSKYSLTSHECLQLYIHYRQLISTIKEGKNLNFNINNSDNNSNEMVSLNNQQKESSNIQTSNNFKGLTTQEAIVAATVTVPASSSSTSTSTTTKNKFNTIDNEQNDTTNTNECLQSCIHWFYSEFHKKIAPSVLVEIITPTRYYPVSQLSQMNMNYFFTSSSSSSITSSTPITCDNEQSIKSSLNNNNNGLADWPQLEKSLARLARAHINSLRCVTAEILVFWAKDLYLQLYSELRSQSEPSNHYHNHNQFINNNSNQQDRFKEQQQPPRRQSMISTSSFNNSKNLRINYNNLCSSTRLNENNDKDDDETIYYFSDDNDDDNNNEYSSSNEEDNNSMNEMFDTESDTFTDTDPENEYCFYLDEYMESGGYIHEDEDRDNEEFSVYAGNVYEIYSNSYGSNAFRVPQFTVLMIEKFAEMNDITLSSSTKATTKVTTTLSNDNFYNNNNIDNSIPI